jgi:hypothetical protein
MMILLPHSTRRSAGWTLIDLLVVMAGGLFGCFVSSCFQGTSRTIMFYTLPFAFGIGFWCLLFLWLLPLIRRRKEDQSRAHDDNTPKAA